MVARQILLVAAAVITTFVLTSLIQPLSHISSSAQGLASCSTFRQTGKTVCGRFLEFWREHGGVTVFGYPITDPFSDLSDTNGNHYTVQYFERAIFELHPENKPPYDVLLSQLGTFWLHHKYPLEVPGQPYVEHTPVYTNAANVKETRRDVTGVGGISNTTDFTTTDKAQAVLDFYKEVLSKNGWMVYRQGSDSQGSGFVSFVFTSGPSNPAYTLNATTNSTTAGHTSVEVTLAVDYPR